jgi:hypothetical protein
LTAYPPSDKYQIKKYPHAGDDRHGGLFILERMCFDILAVVFHFFFAAAPIHVGRTEKNESLTIRIFGLFDLGDNIVAFASPTKIRGNPATGPVHGKTDVHGCVVFI